jgi:hypothetical protein
LGTPNTHISSIVKSPYLPLHQNIAKALPCEVPS